MCKTIGIDVLIYCNPNFLNDLKSGNIEIPSNTSFFIDVN